MWFLEVWDEQFVSVVESSCNVVVVCQGDLYRVSGSFSQLGQNFLRDRVSLVSFFYQIFQSFHS